ncbi:dTDP-4-amino-4,6-dideoxy-D-galactose acyltransferase [Alkalibaculum bacchi]|uniref:dTDP-4-amino-4,6-dideoxy-D-galactose acyltransferase n=1 Tax=Alkalibaculum bacchi TaxID=645887 RepID=A0A366IG34_9FIRM|nr:GNAT family N-acetyltransferase [Alkalibaculum bacchi]RBP69086.1 dTDP-4-amino-4,6-dideoxy-D-galactose acyltransferase [Alkalibaculum bacchi]
MINIKIKKLDWDSKFWGFNIYNANKSNNLIDFERNLISKLDSTPFIIQALSSESDIQYINCLEDNGFRFVESKINLVQKVQQQSNISELSMFQDVREEHLLVYKDDFYDLYGNVSRFALFDKEKVNEFYYKWAVKSIKGNFDDNCIGYYRNNLLEGFITYKIVNQKLIIGLLGVFPKYQGRKISRYLLSYINYIAFKNACGEISVSTQGKNTKAINTYIKNGFIIENIKHWYYYKGELK